VGYTHYWRLLRRPEPQEWADLCNKAQRVLTLPKAAGLVQLEHDTPQPPRVEPGEIRFNGIGGDAHETFLLTPDETFTFCKTAEKPYDAVVTAVLLTAADAFGYMFSVSSDGYWDDWDAGRALYKAAFDVDAVCPWLVKDCVTCHLPRIDGKHVSFEGRCYACLTPAERVAWTLGKL